MHSLLLEREWGGFVLRGDDALKVGKVEWNVRVFETGSIRDG